MFHFEGAPLQIYCSSILQLALHPSLSRVFLSSHSSESPILPSPQVFKHAQIEGEVGVHSNPVSINQVELHPFPDAVLPSSHFSEEFSIESPYREHTLGFSIQE